MQNIQNMSIKQKSYMQNLDKLSVDQVKQKAIRDAKMFCAAKISKHTTVNSSGSSYINFDVPIDYVSFTIKNNPLGIYTEKWSESDLAALKPVDYTFSTDHVSDNVVTYFNAYNDYVNEHFDFTKIKGDTMWQDDDGNDGKFDKLKSMFKQPKKKFNKDKEAIEYSPTARLAIRPCPSVNKVPASSYKLVVKKHDNTIIDNIPNRKTLIEHITKRSSHKVYIKPAFLNSCYTHYKSMYKISWQIFMINETSTMINEIDLMKEFLKIEDDETPIAAEQFSEDEQDDPDIEE